MNECIKCTDDYWYLLRKDGRFYDSIEDLIYYEFDGKLDDYKHEVILTVSSKKIIKAGECNAFDVKSLLIESDCKIENKYNWDYCEAFVGMDETKQQELQGIINNYLNKHVKTEVYTLGDLVGYIILTKDILNDGKPIDGKKFQIHKTYPSIV